MTLTATETISDVIEGLVESYEIDGCLREFINEGRCDRFAEIIVDSGFGEAVWGDGLPRNAWSPAITDEMWDGHYRDNVAPYHCFIMYDGRYYDSESPDGVEWPDQLKCFVRLEEYWRR